MFKHRLSKLGRLSLLAVCLLFVGGSLQSCKDWLDDYKYDDPGDPEWLGASVYAFLKEGTENHTYNNYVELIDSLGEQETLAHTGSKTLFVADDAAFERFFANCNWVNNGKPVTCIADMSKAQMKTILYNSMLNNALLLDMMASTGAAVTDEGTCLRRTTSFTVLDTVPLVDGSTFQNHTAWPTYNVYWDALRGTERTEKMRIAMDGTEPMMVHFLGDYLKRNGIKVSDINFLFKGTDKQYNEGDAMVYGNKIVNSDVDAGEFSDDSLTITCKNGYIYRLDEVLLPPANMAGELRNRDDVRIFSHLLDRFCVPVYDATLTAKYRERYDAQDSVFTLRYFSKGDFTTESNLKGKNPPANELLSFDPGKNQLAGGHGVQGDMAAMFVPKDQHLYDYFVTGGGKFLLDHFAPEANVEQSYSPEAVDSLLAALDLVPQVNIAPFLNNLMESSFADAVPSKFEKITNDANDDMKLREQHVDECVIANNGVIYLLNQVFSPATYSAVSAPTLVYDDLTIMRMVISELRYDYYLLAMDADYSFIIPDDNNFIYFDPVTYDDPTKDYVAYSFHYNTRRPKGNANLELWSESFKIDRTTGKVDTLLATTAYSLGNTSNPFSNAMVKNRMTDILEYLIIVHESNDPVLRADKKYYSTKGYGTIKIDASDPASPKFYGGEQIERGTTIVASRIIEKDNGITYCTTPADVAEDSLTLYSSIPTPPTRSVYTNMYAHAQNADDLYYEFFSLCNAPNLEKLLQTVFPLVDNNELRNDSLKLYSVFFSQNGDEKITMGVPFFNTYHYTVYIPSNESIQELYAKGFPTWQMVADEAEVNPDRAASLVRYLNNFVRYHFQDNSVFCDECDFSIPSPNGVPIDSASYATAVIDPATGRFYETVVKSEDNTIVVKDGMGNWAKVVKTSPEEENFTWNVMCRDLVYKGGNIETSSYSVLQPIDRALQNASMYGYDGGFQRFAKTGEPVDVMTIIGGQGGLAGGAEDLYLVGRAGKHTLKNGDDTTASYQIACLLKPIDDTHEEWNPALAHETNVVDADGLHVYVTDEGYRVLPVGDKDSDFAFEFYTEERDGGEYIIKVDNSGNEIGNKLFKATAVEEPEEGEGESSDNNSDEE